MELKMFELTSSEIWFGPTKRYPINLIKKYGIPTKLKSKQELDSLLPNVAKAIAANSATSFNLALSKLKIQTFDGLTTPEGYTFPATMGIAGGGAEFTWTMKG